MMFKKGSFEIGATVYPVAIKVRMIFFLFCKIILNCLFRTIFILIINSGFIDCHSMIPDLETPSGIAASLAWSTTCYA